MGLRFKNQDFGSCFFITTSFANNNNFGLIDGVYEILAEAINFRLDKERSKLLAYVFMPSHLHMVLLIGGVALSDFMRDFKKYTAQKHLIEICKSNPVWQERFDRQAIWSYDVLTTKIEYIHNNPVKAGLVDSSEKWLYSSAGDYMGRGKSPVEICKEWW